MHMWSLNKEAVHFAEAIISPQPNDKLNFNNNIGNYSKKKIGFTVHHSGSENPTIWGFEFEKTKIDLMSNASLYALKAISVCASMCSCVGVGVEQNENYQRAKFKWIDSHIHTMLYYKHLICERRKREKKSNLFFVHWQVGIQQKSIDSWLIFVMITYHSFSLAPTSRVSVSPIMYAWTWLYAYAKHVWMTKSVENKMNEALNSKVNLNILFSCYLMICHSSV